MSVHAEGEIKWDGQSLSVLVRVEGDIIMCIIPRDTIHGISIYRDAIGREIERDKADIFDRIQSHLLRKIQSGKVDRTASIARVYLELQDLVTEQNG